MAAVWLYVVGSIFIGILIFTIALHLVNNLIRQAQINRAVSEEFGSFKTGVKTVCMEEVNNTLQKGIFLPFPVRVVYATDEKKVLPKVVDKIRDREVSSGHYLCIQIKGEDFLRCSDYIECNVKMPYIGILPETEDIWVMVNRILGRGEAREYNLRVKKTGGMKVDVTEVL